MTELEVLGDAQLCVQSAPRMLELTAWCDRHACLPDASGRHHIFRELTSWHCNNFDAAVNSVRHHCPRREPSKRRHPISRRSYEGGEGNRLRDRHFSKGPASRSLPGRLSGARWCAWPRPTGPSHALESCRSSSESLCSVRHERNQRRSRHQVSDCLLPSKDQSCRLGLIGLSSSTHHRPRPSELADPSRHAHLIAPGRQFSGPLALALTRRADAPRQADGVPDPVWPLARLEAIRTFRRPPPPPIRARACAVRASPGPRQCAPATERARARGADRPTRPAPLALFPRIRPGRGM
jgi:hypothetical protein